MNNLKKNNHKKIITLIVIIALVIDQIFKIIAYKQGLYIAKTNAVTSSNGYYILVSLIVIFMIIRYISLDNTFIKLDTKIILSFAIAGAAGNFIDRIWNKEVVTFINLGKYLNINLAYIYIFIAWIGMAMILTKNTVKIMQERKDKLANYERKMNSIDKKNKKD